MSILTGIHQWKKTLKEINFIKSWIIKLSMLKPVFILFKQTLIDLKQKIMKNDK